MEIPRPKLNRIPGDVRKGPSERYVEDFCKLTKLQMLELRDRQLKLLVNKQRISKLPDKGKRIQDFLDKIESELAHRNEVQSTVNLFSNLNLASTGREKLNTLEWTGKIDPDEDEPVLDSDDEEETDPLKILAQSMNLNKVVKYMKPAKSLITINDLKEIQSFEEEKSNASLSSGSSSNILDLEPHALYLMEKNIDHLPAVEKFKPYKTTISNVHDPEKEKLRKKGKYWENTAATPPLIVHSNTQMLSLHDSVEIQAEYRERIKKLLEKQAEERLLAKQARLEGMIPELPEESSRIKNKFFGSYREAEGGSESDSEHFIDSEDEVEDDVEDRGGIVNYNVEK